MGFNSRPRTRAATKRYTVEDISPEVSIRARARGLQQHKLMPMAKPYAFQFAPAHAGCNSFSRGLSQIARSFQFAPAHAGCNRRGTWIEPASIVSIRARARGLQPPPGPYNMSHLVKFQFAPAHAGCNGACPAEGGRQLVFQFAPAHAGCNRLSSKTDSRLSLRVSIRARARGLQRRNDRENFACHSFNSRPRTRAATLMPSSYPYWVRHVSIRARARGLQPYRCNSLRCKE